MPREGETAGKVGPSWDHGRLRPAACRALSAFVRAAHRGPLPKGRSVLVLERSKSTVPTAPPLAPREARPPVEAPGCHDGHQQNKVD